MSNEQLTNRANNESNEKAAGKLAENVDTYGHVVSRRSSGEISFRGSWPFRYGGVTYPASYGTSQ